jgi:hypothetical protein
VTPLAHENGSGYFGSLLRPSGAHVFLLRSCLAPALWEPHHLSELRPQSAAKETQNPGRSDRLIRLSLGLHLCGIRSGIFEGADDETDQTACIVERDRRRRYADIAAPVAEDDRRRVAMPRDAQIALLAPNVGKEKPAREPLLHQPKYPLPAQVALVVARWTPAGALS